MAVARACASAMRRLSCSQANNHRPKIRPNPRNTTALMLSPSTDARALIRTFLHLIHGDLAVNTQHPPEGSRAEEYCRDRMDRSYPGSLMSEVNSYYGGHMHWCFRRNVARVGLLAWVCLLPALASAQSQITGQVKDESGGVLPGVTVEAASPALIEKSKSAVTDSQGRYTIVDLRQGTYKVSFSLAGFATVVRDAVELPANFTATVNADLKVGALEETITVSGQTPLVDVQQAA